MRRLITGSIRSQIQQIREAYQALPYEEPDWDDPVAVRYDMAKRIHGFMQIKFKEEGYTGPYHHETIADYYQWIEAREKEEEGGES